MQIPFLDLRFQNNSVKDEITAAFGLLLEESNYILGKQVSKFEDHCNHYFNSKYTVGVGNGLDAIILSLRAAGISVGDEVIVPANTYIATWIAVTQVGAQIIPVEPNRDTLNIDVSKIEEKITSNTKAIIPVHLFGNPCEMSTILSIAKKNNLIVIEDNAQAQGAEIYGVKTGSIGDFGATSLYPGKNLGALGDAGIIFTQKHEYDQTLRKLRNYGSNVKYQNEIIGTNSRLDELQAAMLNIKIKYLDTWNNTRINIAINYLKNLGEIPQIKFQQVLTNHKSVYHQFVILTNERDKLQDYLRNKGIQTLIHYPIPPHLQGAYSHLNFKLNSFPITETIANNCLSLPIFPGLDEEKIEFIIQSIKIFYGSN
jgi:dTDP-4-amino-4,6-dideoxygalactose transaminase